jgi:hypothetical protein
MGVATEVFKPEDYEELVATFPPVVLAQRVKWHTKFSISPEQEPKQFFGFLKVAPAWQRFYDYTRSSDFIQQFAGLVPDGSYAARFEFSFMPWLNGLVQPHRDAPPKVAALVLPMVLNERPEWGGYTEMLEPKGPPIPADELVAPFERFDTILNAHFKPKAANFLVRSDKSWHGVRCHGPKGEYRKSITLNLVGEEYGKAA